MRKVVMHFDGACTNTAKDGNIGIGVYAYYSDEPQQHLFEISKPFGIGTNNEAEYTSLIVGLTELVNRKFNKGIVEVKGDSKLVINQVNNVYATNEFRMYQYRNKVQEMMEKYFPNITLVHIPREENSYADELATRNIKNTLRDYYKINNRGRKS